MTRIRSLALPLTALALCAGCAAGSSPAAEPEPPAATEAAAPAADTGVDALFTAEQARRGEAVYQRVCLECHTRTEFTERPFLFAWEGTSVAQVYSYIAENMPDDGPGSLPERTYLDAMAYILELNGYPAGTSELTGDLERMGAVAFESRNSGRP